MTAIFLLAEDHFISRLAAKYWPRLTFILQNLFNSDLIFKLNKYLTLKGILTLRTFIKVKVNKIGLNFSDKGILGQTLLRGHIKA
jgi:hypothetical protein